MGRTTRFEVVSPNSGKTFVFIDFDGDTRRVQDAFGVSSYMARKVAKYAPCFLDKTAGEHMRWTPSFLEVEEDSHGEIRIC